MNPASPSVVSVPRFLLSSLAASMMYCAGAMAQSADDESVKPANKLTLGLYHFSETGNATDINLRHTNELGNTRIGYYHSAKREEHQGRVGWDNTFDFDLVRVTPSAQYASRGYLNGSINVETGDSWFVGAGFGRTNLKPNWNLNFDPNDSWTASAGWRRDGESIALLWIRDNRENPDQRHLHAVYRKSLANGRRVLPSASNADRRGSAVGDLLY